MFILKRKKFNMFASAFYDRAAQESHPAAEAAIEKLSVHTAPLNIGFLTAGQGPGSGKFVVLPQNNPVNQNASFCRISKP